MPIWFLGEKIGPRETVGILLALVSVVALSYETRPGDAARPLPSPKTQIN